jgi:hypothetical protein
MTTTRSKKYLRLKKFRKLKERVMQALDALDKAHANAFSDWHEIKSESYPLTPDECYSESEIQKP